MTFYSALLTKLPRPGNAYVTQWQGGGLHIINAGNPAILTQTAVYNLPQYAESVAVNRNTAFVVQYNVRGRTFCSIRFISMKLHIDSRYFA